MPNLLSRLLLCLAILLVAALPLSAQTPDKLADQAARRSQSGNLVGHGGPVKAIASDSLGQRILTGSFDYAAVLWDVTAAEPKQLLRLTHHNGSVNAVAFAVSRTGQVLVTAGDDGKVGLFDQRTGVTLLDGHVGKIVAVDIMPGTPWIVSAGWDKTARLWHIDDKTAGPVLSEHTGPVNAAVFSGDGKTVFTASYDGDIRAFDRATGAFQRRVYAAGQSVNVLRRLNSGTRTDYLFNGARSSFERDDLLFGTVDGRSGIVDGRSGDIVREFAVSDRPILALADATVRPGNQTPASAQSLIAIGSGDGKVRIISANDGRVLHDHKTPFGPVWAVAFKREKTNEPTALYHAGLDDFVTLWPFAPRAAFDHVDISQYPRRFQVAGTADTAVGRGEIQFARKCSICHTLTPDSANRAGPTLHNIFGRRIATLPGYPYSPELKTLDIVWSAETISKLFELGPDKFTPGSKMPLQVMSNQAERDDLIAFLQRATRDDGANHGAPVDATPPTPHKTP